MDEEIYLTDLFAPVFAKWKRVLAITLICAAIGLLVAVRTPRSYESSFTIYVQQNSPMSALRSSLPISIGGMGGNSVGYYTALLRSDTLLRKTVGKLNSKYDLLDDRAFNEGERISFNKAVRKVRKRVSIDENKSGTVEVRVRWPDRTIASRIARELMDSLGGSVSSTSDRKVDYIRNKLDETTRQLDEAQDKLLAFQKESGVPVLEEEGKRLVEALSKMDGQLLVLDVDLVETKSNLGNAGNLDSLVEEEIKKRGIESGREHVIKERDAILGRLNSLPDVASTYIRLQRDVMVLSKTFELLTERYQLSRIEQQGDGGQYEVIDRPRAADLPMPRGTAAKTAQGGFIGFMVSSAWIMVASFGRKRKKGLR